MSIGLPIFDFLPHCQPCLACCHAENVFTDDQERKHFGVATVMSDKCHNLAEDGRCGIHEVRPTECRLYPLDIKRIRGVLTWLVWDSCPASSHLPTVLLEQDMCKHESVLSKDWVDGYVGHHENNEPEKYGSMKATVLRPLNIKE